MVQITIHKWFRLGFRWFFHVSPWFISYKTPKYLIFLGFLKILRENGPIFAKNGSRSLKSRYLKNTFSLITWERSMLESWNLAKLWEKMIGKTCTVQIFDFWPHFEKNGLCMLQNRFSKIFKNPKNIRYFGVLYDINHGDTWKTIKNQV